MTAGITGVFWLPRMAETNSIMLNAGARAVPISAAAAAWGGLTAAWTDATATLTRVMAELGVGMQGVNGIAALDALAGFEGWTYEQSAMAASMCAKTSANATAYTVAAIAMPSLPEIATVNAAVVASANPPGAVSGAFEAAEATKAVMDLRAALVMETYEAATTTVVTTPGEFHAPPSIAVGAGMVDGGLFENDPLQTAVATAASVLNNPGLAGAVSQVANVVGTVASGGASTVGNLGAGVIAAAANTAPAMSGAPAGLMGAGLGAGAGGASLAASTRAATVGVGSTVNLQNGSLQLPQGWGSGASTAATPAAAPVTEVVTRLDSSAAVRPASASGSPLLGRTAQSGEDDETEHKAADYLRDEHFGDNRLATDGVIGGAPLGSAE